MTIFEKTIKDKETATIILGGIWYLISIFSGLTELYHFIHFPNGGKGDKILLSPLRRRVRYSAGKGR